LFAFGAIALIYSSSAQDVNLNSVSAIGADLDLPFPHNVESENEEEGNVELSGRFGNGG
jgi:hypothetical protein